MPISRTTIILGVVLICGSIAFLLLSAALLPVAIRNTQEFGYCVVGYLELLSAAASGIIGLSVAVAGILVLSRAQRRPGR